MGADAPLPPSLPLSRAQLFYIAFVKRAGVRYADDVYDYCDAQVLLPLPSGASAPPFRRFYASH